MTRRIRARAPYLALAGLSLLVSLTAGCRPSSDADATPAEPPALVIAPENIAVVEMRDLRSGPSISGALEPARQAALRAETGGSVLEVLAEAGQAVRQGQVLLRLDGTALRDAARSAESGVRLSREQADVARRNLERAERLAAAGAVADQAVEQARATRLGADAALAEAESRLTSARTMLGKTEIRAPFAGVVGVRTANLGDVVQPGTPLVTVVDPARMRLNAAVPLEALDSIRVGARVDFVVPGYEGREFTGTIERISPAVDPATRQLPITVAIPNPGGVLVAGLYAEGRVSLQASTGLVVPFGALDLRGAAPRLSVLRQGRTVAVVPQLGLRDEVLELVEVTGGLVAGDTVLLGSARAIPAGTPARVGQDR